MVTKVSTLHTVDEAVQSLREKLRVITTNKKGVEEVWGKGYEANMMIPKTIVNYNHWMLDVNRCNQLIAYYRPELKYRRILMSVMINSLDMLKVNYFLVYNLLVNDNKMLPQKKFILDMVETLLKEELLF